MAVWNGTVTTQLGLNLITKVMAGKTSLSFTGFKTSDGAFSNVELKSMASLPNVKQEFNVSNINIQNSTTVLVKGVVTNTGLSNQYLLNAVGLYATDPDLGEILFSVTTADIADVIPAKTNTNTTSLILNVLTSVTDANKVTLSLSEPAIVTTDMLEIYIKNTELQHLLNLQTPYARLTDLFDGSVYRLREHWQREQGQQNKLAKAIQETDEKVGLILMLEKGTFIHPLPTDGSVQPLSELEVKAELLYNRIPFSKILFMINLSLGVLSFLLLLHNSLQRNILSPKAKTISRTAGTIFSVALYLAFIFHLAGYCLRWYIGGRIPLSNGYETMQFMALCILLIACLLHRRFSFILPFGFLLSGFALLVSYLGQMNPQITPLMPVLVSPWLSIHVSLIMMSYALLAFIMLNGILALCLRKKESENNVSGNDAIQDNRIEQLTLVSRLLLYPATFFLGAGIFLGAVWANVSWGRYWAWDPKEVWALITFLVYGAAFHSQSLRIFRKPLFFHIYMILAFLTVLMTYFGVNYVLGGMHSYANS